MSDPSTIAVALFALGVAAWVAWLQWPSPPALDAERWFKLAMVTLLRGRVDAAGQGVEMWDDLVLRWVPYHPAGRLPAQKVLAPRPEALPGPALEGERALVEALATIPDLPGRWARLYDLDEDALEARRVDPVALGADYDPRPVLGPGGSWDDLADWGAADGHAFRDALLRHPLRWLVVVGGGEVPPLAEALLAQVEGASRVAHNPNDLEGDEVVSALDALIEAPSDRLVLVGEGVGIQRVLRALAGAPLLRERVVAVVSLGGLLAGEPDDSGPLAAEAVADWMGAWFKHRTLDRELVGWVPYFSLAWLDRALPKPGVQGRSLRAQRFPEPADDDAGEEAIQLVDLGLLPADQPDLDLALVAQALWALVGWWVQRGQG